MLRRGSIPVWVGILVLSGMFLIGQDTWPPSPEHTIVGNVTIIEDFPIPELNRTRDIWIYLPPNYEDSTRSYYPVFYMHDGQNLFDVATSSAGAARLHRCFQKLWYVRSVGKQLEQRAEPSTRPGLGRHW